MDLRCAHKLQGIVISPADDGIVELKCSSRFCGAGAGVVVLHRFSTRDGSLLETRSYKNPEFPRKGK